MAGAIAGAINAVAGGGSLVSFPTLVALGAPSIPANATNAIALWPGSLASVWSYRSEAKGAFKTTFVLTIPAIIGAIIGTWTLLHTPEVLFRRIVPWLILMATILLWQQPRLKKYLEKHKIAQSHIGYACFWQLLVAIYGGYFGAGMGILMLAILGFTVEGNIHKLNAIKTWLSTIINVVASIYFLSANTVLVFPGIALGIGAIIGGYGGARLALKIDPQHIRYFIIFLGTVLTIIFALKY